MERLDHIHRQDLSAGDFSSYPIWVWDDEQRGHHPLGGSGSLPDEFATLFIKATFKTAGGKDLAGYLVGMDTFYAFCLFFGGRDYLVNVNLPDLSANQLQALEAALGGPILPLRYRAEVSLDDMPQITGTFGEGFIA